MSTKEVDATARPAPPSPRRGIRGFADRWTFRRKLNLLVGVPLTVVAALLAYLIVDQVGQSQDAKSAADLVRNSEQVATLVNKVESEHQLAILLSVRYEAGGQGTESTLAAYRRAQQAVDTQITRVRDAFGDELPDSEAQALKEVEGLTSLRGTVEQSYLPASNIDPAYDNAARTLIDGLGLDRNAELAATFTGNLLDSLLRADAAHGSFETGVFSATTGDTNALIEFTTAVGAYELYENQAQRFGRFASEKQADQLTGIEHTAAMREISEAYAELQVAPSTLQAETPADIKAAFRDALGDYPAYPQQAASRLKITSSLIDQIADRADASSSDAAWRAGLLLNIGLLGFALWIAFSIIVRRSVVRPVMALTGAAQEVADVAGRELARVADDDAEDDSPPKLREMPVTANDEIGALAEVFNRVQTTAIALLERQVLSRRNVAEMFGNVGRRVSNLTTRQLALIDAVERGETDPALLERLYSIDHIAVRLRRNADSLMLLAGIRETVLDSGPTALTNVVRAALGQIEGFQRVQLHARTEVMVEPDIIGDLTLMVAELLENAVSFSPVGSPVEVYVKDSSGEDSPAGATIVIADHGLGMGAERLAEENARLIRRERLDVVPTKVLGLFVVGTLARRWDVAVTLSRTPGGGVTAEVTVPSALLLTMSPVGVAAGGSTGAQALGGATGAQAVGGATGPRVSGGSTGSRVSGGSVGAQASGGSAAADQASGGPVAADRASGGPVAADRASGGSVAADRASGGSVGAARVSGGATVPSWAERGDDAPAGVSGPRPSSAVEENTGLAHGTTADGRPSPLPRRVPRRETDAEAAADAVTASAAPGADPDATPAAASGHETAPFIPQARTEEAGVTHARSGDSTPGRVGGLAEPVSSFEVRAGGTVPSGSSPTGAAPPPGDGSARPLRRRVRGATLRTTVDAAQQAARQVARPADAAAVRDALDEFEAAVARANRDSRAAADDAPGAGRPGDRPTPDPQDQNHLPEGAEQ
ncbi:ATP-binding protein [Streptomyces cylindrosporus]|uniref:histidine kinase n=1 Tax=Streptomyces cylindrosporus TaxID=2927583 RepID=A0ABS9Y363_9ACTN|nr:ATP-binding protein [Streptomyces cylindrosporus]MCI3271638.1 HAMP domain-containing protein [Streptomyces cylindrosporus]